MSFVVGLFLGELVSPLALTCREQDVPKARRVLIGAIQERLACATIA